MTTRRRDPAKELFWKQVVTRWRRSGLSVRAFCARESLSEPSFYVWRRELWRRGGGAPGAAASPFVAVKVVESPPPEPPPSGEPGAPIAAAGASAIPVVGVPGAIEVLLGDGTVVRVGAGFDAATLRAVVAALAGPPRGESPC